MSPANTTLTATFTYPPYTPPALVGVQVVSPLGQIGTVSLTGLVCEQADAQAICDAIAPLYQAAGKVPSLLFGKSAAQWTVVGLGVADTSPSGLEEYVYPANVTLREYSIMLFYRLPNNRTVYPWCLGNCQEFISEQNVLGIGAPGRWTLDSKDTAYGPPFPKWQPAT